jgi:hypothetical protein
MFLLLGSRRDLHGETMLARRRAYRQRHCAKAGLGRVLLDRGILGGRLRAAPERDESGSG